MIFSPFPRNLSGNLCEAVVAGQVVVLGVTNIFPLGDGQSPFGVFSFTCSVEAEVSSNSSWPLVRWSRKQFFGPLF